MAIQFILGHQITTKFIFTSKQFDLCQVRITALLYLAQTPGATCLWTSLWQKAVLLGF